MTGAAAAWRMEAMCAAVGVEAPREARAAMAGNCAWCEKGEDCRLWRLEEHVERGRVPEYCLNAELIETLAGADRSSAFRRSVSSATD
jgi:hypothetical protein